MGGLFETLQKIRNRPGMYIGKPSITILRHFLVGYAFARNELGIKPTEEELDFYQEFHPWIEKRFRLRTSNSWANIILLYSRDEKEAFYFFFKLLEQFLTRDRTLEDNNVEISKIKSIQN